MFAFAASGRDAAPNPAEALKTVRNRAINMGGCALGYASSDILHYKTHDNIYVLYPFRAQVAQAGWVASRLVLLVAAASKDHRQSTGRCH